MTPYEPVPVEAARAVAEKYGKSIVIIFAHDPVHGLLHTTTYGDNPQNKAWAAKGGEIASKALGGVLDESTHFEDYRLQQAQMLLGALEGLIDAWWDEFSYFLGGDAESVARKLSDFESQPAVIAARAAVELARRFVPGGSGNPSGEPSADSSGTEQPKDKTK